MSKSKLKYSLSLLFFIITLLLCGFYQGPILVYVDNSAPTITIDSYSYSDAVLIIKGTAYDSYSGVAAITVSIDGKEYEPVSTFTDETGGEWEFRYDVSNTNKDFSNFVFRAEDLVGNFAEAKKENIPLDATLPRLVYPDYIPTNVKIYPTEVFGEPVRATAVLIGNEREYELGELGSDFGVIWNGYFDDKPAPDGRYTISVTAYSKTGRTTNSLIQVYVGKFDISGTVSAITGSSITVDGKTYVINSESKIDANITVGDVVAGTGRLDSNGKQAVLEIKLIKKHQDTISGAVTAITPNSITIGNTTYILPPGFVLDPNIEVGDTVKGFSIGNADGSNTVESLSLVKKGRKNVTGVVDSISGNKIVVDGIEYDITSSSDIDKNIEVGDLISLTVIGNETGGFEVEKAELIKKGRHPVEGVVNEIGDGYIVIDGVRYGVTPSSEIDQRIYAGDTVKGFVIGNDNKGLDIESLTLVSSAQPVEIVPISGTVNEIGNGYIIINRIRYEITDNSVIDPNIKVGVVVSGFGMKNRNDGVDIISLICKGEQVSDNYIGEEVLSEAIDILNGVLEFVGIIEAVGDDYIVVDGVVYYINEHTEFDCAGKTCSFGDFKVGDFVNGSANSFSISGNIALELNKPFDDTTKNYTIYGRVVGKGNGWVEIETGTEVVRLTVTDDTFIPTDYQIGDIVRIDVLTYDDGSLEALAIIKLEYGECDPETIAYHYGHLDYILQDTKEFIVDEQVYIPSANMIIDDHIADYEKDAYLAFVNRILDDKCEVIVTRVVQNAGAPLPEDMIIGNVTEISEQDVNNNIPVYIDDEYYFMTNKTNVSEELFAGQLIAATKVGEELISIYAINDLALYPSDFQAITGTIERISGTDTNDRYYILVNGVNYRVTSETVFSDSRNMPEQGDYVALSVRNGDVVLLSVIKSKFTKELINIIY